MYIAQLVATDSDSQFAFNQSLCMAAIDLDPCVHSPKINKIRDRNHFNVLLNPSLCVLRLSLLRLISAYGHRSYVNFIFVAVGKNFSFLSSNKEGIKCDLFPLELKPVLKKPPAYAEEPPDYSGHVFSPGPRA